MRNCDARQTFLGIWIKLLLQGQPFEVWGGDQKRDFTYVDDATSALMLTAINDSACGRVFNVGGDRVVTLNELAKLLIEAGGDTGRCENREFPDNRKQIDIGDYYADDRQIRETLGWKPQVTIENGLRRTLDFYRENLAHYV
jgi:nucleoside-diphosphate-sugar epimerase